MDIEYLLMLQSVRESLPDFLTTGLAYLSDFGSGVPFVGLFIILYWLWDKRLALRGVMSFTISMFICQVSKVFLCVNRPWVLDSRVQPQPHAMEEATGYSCPSGHSSGSVSTMLAFVRIFKEHKVWCAIVLVFMVVFVFLRNFLGVHCPQDVILGVAVGVLSFLLSWWILGWAERHGKRHREVVVLVIVSVLSLAALVAVVVKPYPLEYRFGVLLVNPDDMMKDAVEGVGVFWGSFVGWFIERRFVDFEPLGFTKRGIVLALAGLAVSGAAYVAADLAESFVGVVPSSFAKYFLLTTVSIGLWPMALLKWGGMGHHSEHRERRSHHRVHDGAMTSREFEGQGLSEDEFMARLDFDIYGNRIAGAPAHMPLPSVQGGGAADARGFTQGGPRSGWGRGESSDAGRQSPADRRDGQGPAHGADGGHARGAAPAAATDADCRVNAATRVGAHGSANGNAGVRGGLFGGGKAKGQDVPRGAHGRHSR